MKIENKLPLEEAIKIQEALKPLGYAVVGYKSGLASYLGEQRTNLCLEKHDSLIVRIDAAASSNVD